MTRDIFQTQSWQHGLILGLLLELLQLVRFLHNTVFLLICQCQSESLKLLAFHALTSTRSLLIWRRYQLELEWVIEQVLFDEAFEQLTLVKIFAHSTRVLIYLEETQGITAVQAEGYHVSEVAEPAVILGLLRVELKLMQNGLEELFVETDFSGLFQDAIDLAEQLVSIPFKDSLHTNSERSLSGRVVEAVAGTVGRRKTRLDELLEE